MRNVQFWDCMPAMADVFSGTYKRPEFIETDVIANITGEPPTLFHKRISELGKLIVIAERDQSPLYFAGKSKEIRSYEFPGSPVLLAGGRWLIATNEDATHATVLDVTSTDERVAWIEAQSWLIVARNGVDITKSGKILPLAKQLVETTGCSLGKAKQHVAKSIRRLRGELMEIVQRGGRRKDAGRPRKGTKT